MTSRTLERIAFAVVGVLLVLALAGTKVNSDKISTDAEKGARTYHALCILSQYYGDQIADTKAFLRDPPQSMTPAVLASVRISLHRLEGVVRQYRSLECPVSRK
jgi:hypothetical protein